jgi:hypothetical protein
MMGEYLLEDRHCGDCKWYLPEKLDLSQGRCHRNPPQVVGFLRRLQGGGEAQQVLSVYPPVNKKAIGCGECAPVVSLSEIKQREALERMMRG